MAKFKRTIPQLTLQQALDRGELRQVPGGYLVGQGSLVFPTGAAALTYWAALQERLNVQEAEQRLERWRAVFLRRADKLILR